MTQFNFYGEVRSTNTNMAGRDISITDSRGSQVTLQEARSEARRLREQVRRMNLAPDVEADAARELRSVEEQLGAASADTRTVAQSLERLTKILQDAGALAAAGNALLGPIGSLAHWLGAAGRPLLGLVGLG